MHAKGIAHVTALLLLSAMHSLPAQDTIGPTLDRPPARPPPVYYEQPTDSADFQRFIASLSFATTAEVPGAMPRCYTEVWRIAEHGGLSIVTRGDGSALTLPAGPFDSDTWSASLAFVTPEGRHGLLRMSEYPCAMICRTAVYYLERPER